jgi:uncharacterized membrane protein
MAESRAAARRAKRGSGLDEPLDRSSGLSIRPQYDPEMFGRFSERVARYIGSWRFIALITVLIVLWVLLNIGISLFSSENGQAPDPYPFIFLTLLLSLQASYAAPLILLAQNRQDDRDRVQYSEDRARTDRLISDTEYLMREIAALRQAMGELATRDYLRGEMKDLTEELADQVESHAKAIAKGAGKKGKGGKHARTLQDDEVAPDEPETEPADPVQD